LEVYGIYDGVVKNTKDFGAFVELLGFKREGLVHISQMASSQVRSVNDVVSRGQQVKVKVLSISDRRIALSMKEVDQQSGKDLFPQRSHAGLEALQAQAEGGSHSQGRANRRSDPISPGLEASQLQSHEQWRPAKRSGKRLSSPELWEAQQLINSGVLPPD